MVYGRHHMVYGRHHMVYGRHHMVYGRHHMVYGRHKKVVSSIECSDKQAFVSQEVKKRVTATKPFSRTVRMCYASGVKGKSTVPFIETQCPGCLSDPPYVNVDMYRGVRVLQRSQRYNIL
ncbi:hypothetical protein TNCV_4883561 [Trichonephila clavipes]|nr:hypothetical protein TNCV_4883561 [Trichonephila clavipes]